MSCPLFFSCAFLNKGSSIEGVCLLSYKWGQYSLKGENIRLGGVIFLEGKSFNYFLYSYQASFSVFDYKRGENFTDQIKPKLSNTKNHQILNFLSYQVAILLVSVLNWKHVDYCNTLNLGVYNFFLIIYQIQVLLLSLSLVSLSLFL
jgi:hypothetical protein